MKTRKVHTNKIPAWELLFCLPHLIVVGMITSCLGNVIAESWSPWLAYPTTFVIGVVVAIIGTALFGDFPTTLVEMGCGGVILCVLVAILIPVFSQAREKAKAHRLRPEMSARKSTIHSSKENVSNRHPIRP